MEAEKHQSVSENRERLNLSLGADVKLAVRALAAMLGMTESQVVVHALLMALPQLKEQATTAIGLAELGKRVE